MPGRIRVSPNVGLSPGKTHPEYLKLRFFIAKQKGRAMELANVSQNPPVTPRSDESQSESFSKPEKNVLSKEWDIAAFFEQHDLTYDFCQPRAANVRDNINRLPTNTDAIYVFADMSFELNDGQELKFPDNYRVRNVKVSGNGILTVTHDPIEFTETFVLISKAPEDTLNKLLLVYYQDKSIVWNILHAEKMGYWPNVKNIILIGVCLNVENEGVERFGNENKLVVLPDNVVFKNCYFTETNCGYVEGMSYDENAMAPGLEPADDDITPKNVVQDPIGAKKLFGDVFYEPDSALRIALGVEKSGYSCDIEPFAQLALKNRDLDQEIDIRMQLVKHYCDGFYLEEIASYANFKEYLDCDNDDWPNFDELLLVADEPKTEHCTLFKFVKKWTNSNLEPAGIYGRAREHYMKWAELTGEHAKDFFIDFVQHEVKIHWKLLPPNVGVVSHIAPVKSA